MPYGSLSSSMVYTRAQVWLWVLGNSCVVAQQLVQDVNAYQSHIPHVHMVHHLIVAMPCVALIL